METLPDSNTNTIYSNYAGQDLLDVFTDTTSGNKWGTFYLYDSDGNRVMEAEPSAVNLPSSLSTIEAYNDLLHNTGGSYALGTASFGYLNSSSGLIHIYDYATSTTATTSTAGNVQDYPEDEKVQQGQSGSATTLWATTDATLSTGCQEANADTAATRASTAAP